MAANKIEYLPIAGLKPWSKNARTHSRKQIRQIADSITLFGFTNPVLIDEKGQILAGHGRVAAAQSLGLSKVPCLRIETMTPAEKRAYVIADNKLALNAGWDEEILAQELKDLSSVDLDFDLGITGFSIAEVDHLIEGLEPTEPGDPADDKLPEEGPARCRLGDLWQLGRHRLICGNALDGATIELLMNGEQAQMVFTDPPYNIPIEGYVAHAGEIKYRDFAMACGEMDGALFTNFLKLAFQNVTRHRLDGWIHCICMH